MNVTLPDGRELLLPRLKFGIMGRPGSGKSHLLASMPKPLLVLSTDPEEKLQPYFDRCGDLQHSVGQFGQPVILGLSPTTGKPIMQIEIFYDLEPATPVAMTALLARGEQLRSEVEARGIASVAYDSWSQGEYIAWCRRAHGQFAISNPDGRAVYNAAKDDLKPFMWSRLVPLKCNLGIAFHTEEKIVEEGGVSSFGIKAIGALRTELASILPERYRSVSEPDGTTRRLWTKPDGRFDLCTLIDAPNPCANDYKALFTNWINKRVAAMDAATKPAPSAAPEEKQP